MRVLPGRPGLDLRRSSSGPGQVQIWTCAGPGLHQCRSRSGLAQIQVSTCAGLGLDLRRSRSGPHAGPGLDLCRSRSMPEGEPPSAGDADAFVMGDEVLEDRPTKKPRAEESEGCSAEASSRREDVGSEIAPPNSEGASPSAEVWPSMRSSAPKHGAGCRHQTEVHTAWAWQV